MGVWGAEEEGVCLLVGCLTSQQHASVSQGWICSDNFTCCNTEMEVADQTFYLTQSQYTDTGPTSPSADSITPGTWQGSHWSATLECQCLSHWYDLTPKKSWCRWDSNLGSSTLEEDALPLGQRGGGRRGWVVGGFGAKGGGGGGGGEVQSLCLLLSRWMSYHQKLKGQQQL